MKSSTKQPQTKTVIKQSPNKQALGSSKRKPGNTRVRKSLRNTLSRETLRIRRYELWDEFSVAPGDHTYRRNFDAATGPAWFKAMGALYEMYQIHNIRLYIKPTAASTTSGGWVAAYNTNYAERDATRTAGAVSAQLGSAGNVIFRNGMVYIPASAFKGFSTNTPLRSDNNGWSFNLELLSTGVSTACSIKVYIDYDVTFRNPQLN